MAFFLSFLEKKKPLELLLCNALLVRFVSSGLASPPEDRLHNPCGCQNQQVLESAEYQSSSVQKFTWKPCPPSLEAPLNVTRSHHEKEVISDSIRETL